MELKRLELVADLDECRLHIPLSITRDGYVARVLQDECHYLCGIDLDIDPGNSGGE